MIRVRAIVNCDSLEAPSRGHYHLAQKFIMGPIVPRAILVIFFHNCLKASSNYKAVGNIIRDT